MSARTDYDRPLRMCTRSPVVDGLFGRCGTGLAEGRRKMSKISRREALIGVAGAGAALVISGLLGPPARARSRVPSAHAFPVTAWVRVAQDDSVTLVASQSEMGQGTTTTLAAVLADELYLPFARVDVEFAPFDPAYRDPVYQW